MYLLLFPLSVGDLELDPVGDDGRVAGVAAGPAQGDAVGGHPVDPNDRRLRRH